MALAECLLYEGRSLESARGPQSFRTIPSRQLLTGEPCAGEPHARFGGRGVRLNRTSLPLSEGDQRSVSFQSPDVSVFQVKSIGSGSGAPIRPSLITIRSHVLS